MTRETLSSVLKSIRSILMKMTTIPSVNYRCLEEFALDAGHMESMPNKDNERKGIQNIATYYIMVTINPQKKFDLKFEAHTKM